MLRARLAQHRQPLTGSDDHGAQVHSELHVDVLRCELVHRLADSDTGVVHEHVQPPVEPHRLLDECVRLLVIRDIRAYCGGRASGARDGAGDARGFGLAAPEIDHHARPGGGSQG